MTASAFSSQDTAALERQTDSSTEAPVTFEQIWNETHKKVSLGWIRQNGYKRVRKCNNKKSLRDFNISLRSAFNSQTTICHTVMRSALACKQH